MSDNAFDVINRRFGSGNGAHITAEEWAEVKGATSDLMDIIDTLQLHSAGIWCRTADDRRKAERARDSAIRQAQTWAQEARTLKAILRRIGEIVGCDKDYEMAGAVRGALAAQKGGGDIEHFCHVCRHKWRSDVFAEHCPRCRRGSFIATGAERRSVASR